MVTTLMQTSEFLIIALAAWRLSIMISDDTEHGPWDILMHIRLRVGMRYDDLGLPHGTNMLSKLMLCPKCNSVWIGLAMALLWLIFPIELMILILIPFALSGSVVLLEEILGQE